MLQPSIWPVKSPMLGSGYLSAEVTKLRRRKSLQGRHDPSFFLDLNIQMRSRNMPIINLKKFG